MYVISLDSQNQSWKAGVIIPTSQMVKRKLRGVKGRSGMAEPGVDLGSDYFPGGLADRYAWFDDTVKNWHIEGFKKVFFRGCLRNEFPCS